MRYQPQIAPQQIETIARWLRRDPFGQLLITPVAVANLQHIVTRPFRGERYVEAIGQAFRAGRSVPPIHLANESGWQLLDGNHRLTAARNVFAEFVPALVFRSFAELSGMVGTRAQQELRSAGNAVHWLRKHHAGSVRLNSRELRSYENHLRLMIAKGAGE